ncbi:MAG: DUF192 domain-containing protein [Selenomonadaceae bacterium]|nr:DUF192 domain-containing protein [Selenomonadaceae bacterium]
MIFVMKVKIADKFFSRLLGLMFRKNLESNHGLLIVPCNSIHMLFMRFSIDAVYVDKNFVIKKIVKNLKPYIGFSICLNAYAVLEIVAGEADRLNYKVGQKLIFEVEG